jgi:hypothetical protein
MLGDDARTANTPAPQAASSAITPSHPITDEDIPF